MTLLHDSFRRVARAFAAFGLLLVVMFGAAAEDLVPVPQNKVRVTDQNVTL